MQEIKKWNRADSLIDLESYLASLVSEKYRIDSVVVTKMEFARVESLYVPFEVLVFVERIPAPYMYPGESLSDAIRRMKGSPITQISSEAELERLKRTRASYLGDLSKDLPNDYGI